VLAGGAQPARPPRLGTHAASASPALVVHVRRRSHGR